MENERHRVSDQASTDAASFNRKRDRYEFGVDKSRPPPQRQYIDGVPLLLDLSKLIAQVDSLLLRRRDTEPRRAWNGNEGTE